MTCHDRNDRAVVRDRLHALERRVRGVPVDLANDEAVDRGARLGSRRLRCAPEARRKRYQGMRPHARSSSRTTSPSRMYFRDRSRRKTERWRAGRGRDGSLTVVRVGERSRGAWEELLGIGSAEHEVGSPARRDDEGRVVRIMVPPHSEVHLWRPAELAHHQDVGVRSESRAPVLVG